MKITSDVELRSFQFQSNVAKETVKYLTFSELDRIQQILEEAYPDGMTDSNLEDIFGYEADTIANWIGYDNFDQVKSRMTVQESRQTRKSRNLHCHRKARQFENRKRRTEAFTDYGYELDFERPSGDEELWVCEGCLRAIESHEGRQKSEKVFVDENDELESRCDWCGESGFDTLFRI